MAVKHKAKQAPKPQQTFPQNVGADTAPLYYTDGAISIGAENGIISVDLGAKIVINKMDGTVTPKIMVIARLRMTPQTALALQKNIDLALGYHKKDLIARRNQRLAQARPAKNSGKTEEESATAH